MARTKQIARKSVGGKAPRKGLVNKTSHCAKLSKKPKKKLIRRQFKPDNIYKL